MAKKVDISKVDKAEAMRLAMEGFKKDYGDAIVSGDEKSIDELREELMNVSVIPTGSLSLDSALGVWGFPRGRVVELYGKEHSGKTSIALSTIGCAQRAGGKAVFIDVENALDPLFAIKNGANYQELIHVKPKSGDDAMNALDYWLKKNTEAGVCLIDVIVVDSVAALVTEGQIDKDIGGADVAVAARLMSQTMRKITPFLGETVVIFINQIREKPGVMFGPTEETPGGKALKFYSSVRCAVGKKETLYLMADGSVEGYNDSSKKKIKEVGRRVTVKIDKNKVAPKGIAAEFDYVEGVGIIREREIAVVGIDYGIITQAGAFYTLPDGTKAQGFANLVNAVKDSPALQDSILDQIKTVVYELRKNEVEQQIAKIQSYSGESVFNLWEKAKNKSLDVFDAATPDTATPGTDIAPDTTETSESTAGAGGLVARRKRGNK
jgi:recombination protein RecA